MDPFDFMVAQPPPEPTPALPECFQYHPGLFADLAFEDFEALDWEAKSMYGKTTQLPRLTTMYGAPYRYSGVDHPERPMPPRLQEIITRIEVATGTSGYNAVLGNLYRDGTDSVSWHSDDDYASAAPHIASVSIGATRRFRIRSKGPPPRETHDLDLAHGDLLIMTDNSQQDWMHCVPKTSRKVDPRINLTFRVFNVPM